MGFDRAAYNKIIAVTRLQGQIRSEYDSDDSAYGPGQGDGGGYPYAGLDVPQGEPDYKPRGLTERKKRRSSTSAAAPRPQPPYHNFSSSSAGQPSYYPPSSHPAYAHGSATFYQGQVQGSPPPMHNSTFNPPSQQYQNGSFNQGYAYAHANQPYHNQGQQQQQQQQHQQHQQHQQQQQQYYNQGYNQTYSQYTTYESFPN